MRINIEQARAKLAECLLAAQSGDDERAHSVEDALHHAVIDTIANGQADDPRALAEIAARTAGIDFQRWCA